MSTNGRAAPLSVALDEAECIALLASTSLGRIGTSIDAMPVVLPVAYAVHDDTVVFRTTPGTKLHAATLDSVVALQADSYAAAHEPEGWSALMQGPTHAITDPATLAVVSELPLGRWAHDGTYVALDPAIVTGRRLQY